MSGINKENNNEELGAYDSNLLYWQLDQKIFPQSTQTTTYQHWTALIKT